MGAPLITPIDGTTPSSDSFLSGSNGSDGSDTTYYEATGADEATATDSFGGSSGTYGLAAQGAGDLMSGLGGLYAGGMEASALRMQANLQLQNANLDLLAGNSNAARSQVMSGQRIGAIQGAAAASGVTQSGSVLDVMAASSMNAEMDRQNIIHGSQVKAIQAENQASMDNAGATSAQTGSYFKAFGGLAQTGLVAAAVLA